MILENSDHSDNDERRVCPDDRAEECAGYAVGVGDKIRCKSGIFKQQEANRGSHYRKRERCADFESVESPRRCPVLFHNDEADSRPDGLHRDGIDHQERGAPCEQPSGYHHRAEHVQQHAYRAGQERGKGNLHYVCSSLVLSAPN